MNDKDLIFQFLNRNFNVVIKCDDFIVFDKFKYESIPKFKLMQIIDKIFSSYFIENKTACEIATLWYDDKVKSQLNELTDYLNNCKVVLGDRNWLVLKFDNTEINQEIIVSEFEKLYSKKIIKKYFNVWRDNMVLDVSQKIINGYY